MNGRVDSQTGLHTTNNNDGESNSGLEPPRATKRSLNNQKQIGFNQSIARLQVKNTSLIFTRGQAYATTELNCWINSHICSTSTLNKNLSKSNSQSIAKAEPKAKPMKSSQNFLAAALELIKKTRRSRTSIPEDWLSYSGENEDKSRARELAEEASSLEPSSSTPLNRKIIPLLSNASKELSSKPPHFRSKKYLMNKLSRHCRAKRLP